MISKPYCSESFQYPPVSTFHKNSQPHLSPMNFECTKQMYRTHPSPYQFHTQTASNGDCNFFRHRTLPESRPKKNPRNPPVGEDITVFRRESIMGKETHAFSHLSKGQRRGAKSFSRNEGNLYMTRVINQASAGVMGNPSRMMCHRSWPVAARREKKFPIKGHPRISALGAAPARRVRRMPFTRMVESCPASSHFLNASPPRP